jgi:hypothetical protein
LSTCRASGDLQRFAGPISDNVSALRLPEGETLTDEALLSFNGLVEGVVGQIPE